MGIFEKLKNALFEEEYVEVDDKPKTKPKTIKSKVKSSFSGEKEKVEKPIAKKIVLPEKKETYSDELDEEILDSDFDVEEEVSEERVETLNKEFKIMDDDDFKSDEVIYNNVEPQIVKVIEKDSEIEEHLYQGGKQEPRVKKPYGLDESPKSTISHYGGYDKREERGYFKPSPIISPIYGILDKNYKKEEIVTRKEVRLTSSYAREKLSVDEVRNKAYGTLENDIEDISFEDVKTDVAPTFDLEEDNLLVDLSSDIDKPAVKEVTMGDALEYFQDLGLEYNVDYVDATKKTPSRREKNNYDDVKTNDNEFDVSDELVTDEISVTVDVESNETDLDDDNLFDLIDSMYKEDE